MGSRDAPLPCFNMLEYMKIRRPFQKMQNGMRIHTTWENQGRRMMADWGVWMMSRPSGIGKVLGCMIERTLSRQAAGWTMLLQEASMHEMRGSSLLNGW